MASTHYVKETRDHATGEVTTEERVFTARYKSQPFVSLSLPISPLLHALLNKYGRVLLALAELCEFNTNAVFLVASRRQEVMALAEVSSPQLSGCLKRLREAGIISGGKGEALIHPAVLWKGESARKKDLLARMAKDMNSEFEAS